MSIAVEIGAGDSYSSELLKISNSFDTVILIEPNPLLFCDLAKEALKHPNVTVHNFAISDRTRVEDFYVMGYTSCLKGAEDLFRNFSKTKRENILGHFAVKTSVIGMADFDKGDLDYLVLTCNGSELSALEAMTSRPKGIAIRCRFLSPQNVEYFRKIAFWMKRNGYRAKEISSNSLRTVVCMGFER